MKTRFECMAHSRLRAIRQISCKRVRQIICKIQRIRALNAKAGIVLHDAGGDCSRAQVAGLTSQLEKMGVDELAGPKIRVSSNCEMAVTWELFWIVSRSAPSVIAITNARFKPEKQVADIEAVLIRQPQVIISVPIESEGRFRHLAENISEALCRCCRPRSY
jgi:hypothetical protein